MTMLHNTKLLNAVAATGAGAVQVQPLRSPDANPVRAGAIQALITGVQTLTLEGSCDGVNWITVATLSSSSGLGVELYPYMRGNCTAWTSGAGTLWIVY